MIFVSNFCPKIIMQVRSLGHWRVIFKILFGTAYVDKKIHIYFTKDVRLLPGYLLILHIIQLQGCQIVDPANSCIYISMFEHNCHLI